MDNINYHHLRWDSEFFGFPIGRLTGRLSDSRKLDEFVCWRTASRMRCIYYLASCDDILSVNCAHRLAFEYVGSKVLLRIAYDLSCLDDISTNTIIIPYRANDLTELKAIAAASYQNSRFFSDPHFCKHRVCDMYQLWIENECQNTSGVVLVAHHQGKVAGYISCNALSTSEGQIDLFAVREDARAKGLGGELLLKAKSWFLSRKLFDVHVVTQGGDNAAMHIYQKHGFDVASIQLCFHWWCDDYDLP